MKEYIEILKNTAVFRGMDEGSIEASLPSLDARMKTYERGEYIFSTGQRTASLGIIIEGRVHVIQEEFWGSRNILSSIGEGMCFGEAYACAPDTPLAISVVAEAPCRIIFLNIEKALSEQAEFDSRLAMNLLSDLARKNIYFTEKLNHTGERSTRAKVLSYLSTVSKKKGSTEFDIPFTRQELADYLFVDRSGLSRELCALRDEGYLTFRKNHFILNHEDI